MKQLLIFIVLFWGIDTAAQPKLNEKCPFFRTYIEKGDAELKKGNKANFETAINAYSIAMLHCPDSAEIARKGILKVFNTIEQLRAEAEKREKQAKKDKDHINQLKNEAIEAVGDAIKARDSVGALTDSLQVILSYFAFFKEKVAWAYDKNEGKFGLINTLGEKKSEFIYDIAAVFNDSNDVCITSVNKKSILLNIEGNRISEGEGYNNIVYLRHDRYRADNGYLIQLMDSLSFSYFDSITYIYKYLLKVKRRNKWNLMNNDNKLLFPVDVYEIGDFGENLLRVKGEKGWYYLDTNLNRINDNYFLFASDFNRGEAIVVFEGNLKKITRDFKMVGLGHQNRLLNLGVVDSLSYPDDIDNFSRSISGERFYDKYKNLFRDESSFRSLEKIPGLEVFAIQSLLNLLGFMPQIRNKGIFDYYTQSSIRLMQENFRTILGESNFVPDGVVGPLTYAEIIRTNFSAWDTLGKKQTEEYNFWIKLLEDAKQYYAIHPTPVLEQLNRVTPNLSDTRIIGGWQFHPADVHLIGLRRNADQPAKSTNRGNDDIFILLINGMVFKFWGSTDPNPEIAPRKDMAFLSEGQHKYKIDWFQLNNESKLHLGLYPASKGVLVLRDRNLNNVLDSSDIRKGFDTYPNLTIPFHWSGSGKINWSGSSQIIAGGSYINQYNQVADCSSFAAMGYSDLGTGKTKAAYNMLMDLILTYSNEGMNSTVYYTLLKEGVIEKVRPELGDKFAESLLNRMRKASDTVNTESTEPERATTETLDSKEQSQWHLHVGPFSTLPAAEAHKNKLYQLGYTEASVAPTKSGWYTVRVNRYATRTEADAVMRELKEKHGIAGWVEQLKK